MILYKAIAIALFASALGLPGAAGAQSIVDEWTSIKAPPAPELKPVKAEPKETALLVLDLVKQICPPRPRCVNSVPKVQRLLENARAAGVPVIYSLAGMPIGDTLPQVAPQGGEPSVSSGPDKFLNTDLDKILKEKGIKTVVVVGSAAEGAVLNTSAGAALRGFKVIVPLDGASSSTAFAEQYTAWHLANAPRIGPQVTLTRTDLVSF
jgi:nicotinamidase-related amidase